MVEAPVGPGQWHEPAFAARYDAGFARKVAPSVAERLLERAAPRAGEHILECACGTGVCTTLLARCAGSHAWIAACDRSPAMLAIAARKLQATELPGRPPGLSVQDMQALGFRSGSFDLVVSNLGLHVVPDRGQALREAVRVLRPGGRVAYTVPGEWSLEPFQTWYWERVSRPDLRPFLSAPAKAWGAAEAEASLRADKEMWTALLADAGVTAIEAHAEQMTIWFRDAAEFFGVGAFGLTRRAVEALTAPGARETVVRDISERLDATASAEGVPIHVRVFCLAGQAPHSHTRRA